MKLNIKLSRASYTMHIDGNSMTVEVTANGIDKRNGQVKEVTSILGYYGPAQVDLAINRIIAEELTQDNEKANLREFLIKYKTIHETIAEQVEELKNQISKTREK